MNIHGNRIVFGIIHELILAIEHHRQVLDLPEFRACVAPLARDARRGWKALVSVATDSRKADPFRDFLLKVRHNFVAHYYQPRQLLKAYQHFFFVRPPDDFNQVAYASFGQSMEGTRFYFVDAAPAEYYKNMADPKMLDHARQYVNHINNALRHLLEVFLRTRDARLKKAARKER